MFSDEEWDALPDDPEAQFVQIERALRQRMNEDISSAHNSETTQYYLEYMTKVVGLASAVGLSAAAVLKVPRFADFSYAEFADFTLMVDRLAMEISVKLRQTRRRFSVHLDAATKGKLRHYIEQIKLTLDASPLEEAKRDSLVDKLNAFASEVERNRTSFQAAGALFIDGCAVLGEGIQQLEPIRKWIDSIANLLKQAKVWEDNHPALPAPAPQKRIEGPRSFPKEVSFDLDDEIPF